MSLSIGIVGRCRTWASRRCFTALTKKTGLAANYPFATIDPNVGIVDVPIAACKSSPTSFTRSHRAGDGRVRRHRRSGEGR